MKTSDFDYNLPEELIAHEPAEKRDHSRLMVLDRSNQSIQHKHFYDIVDYLSPGDLLVLNDTKVIPARLFGEKVGGGARVEVLLTKKLGTGNWEWGIRNGGKSWLCFVRPGKRLKIGTKVSFGKGELVGTVVEKLETGEQIIEFEAEGDVCEMIHKFGEVPLPPYIKKRKSENPKSGETDSRVGRYQTVYADKEGASAAPTAGLHFTPELLTKIKAQGIKLANITLHTGLATFQPVRTDEIKDHVMHAEYFEVSEETVEAIKQAERVIAVGTTVVRTLETIYNSPPLSPSLIKRGGEVSSALAGGELKGVSDLFIYPGYKFKVVDAMITNFHWPRSTLIMLVSAFAGKDFIMRSYQEAMHKGYRFFSFGDAMLII